MARISTYSTLKLIITLIFIHKLNSSDDKTFKNHIDNLKTQKQLDIIFLVDGSSSVGIKNFESELNFVKKLLSDFTVSENRTKVSIVIFGSNAIIYEHNDKCELLNTVLPTINYPGSNTNTLGAFLAAKELLISSRKSAKKVIFLVTDGYSNGGNPVPIANDLKVNLNTTIFTLGIRNGNRKELKELTSNESTSFLLKSFEEFDLLARRALHVDLKDGDYIRLEDQKCGGCDPLAICTCGTSSGHYVCKCQPGYFGTGKKGDCYPCPKSTWHDKISGICMPCPDFNHITDESRPAISIQDCFCKRGYKKSAKEDYKCEVMRCPKLVPPENGYFVGKKNCPNVLNSACGVRCNVGYSLRGTSIRICRETGFWDGLEPQCHLKTCPRPPIPVGGEVFCNNTDLELNLNSLPDEMPVDTECQFKCEHGSNLIGSTKRTCLPIEQWDGLKTTCKPVRCVKLHKVPHGKVTPVDCTKDKQKHGAKCTIICDEGYSGPGTVECITKGKHGAWSSKPKCVDITPPNIICPEDIETVAIFNQNYGLVDWEAPKVTDNSKGKINIWWEPFLDDEPSQGPHKFEIGETTVTYFAVDTSGNGAKCNFSVIVLDKEGPKFENCVDPPPYLVGQEGITIEWDDPQVFDNSGAEITILKSKDFGFLPIGTTYVEYLAVDIYNNTNLCIINITVQLSSCENEIPDVCSKSQSSQFCVLTCEEGYAFSITDRATCDPQYANWNIPECTPTEIPNEISATIDKDCLEIKENCQEGACDLLECSEINKIKRDTQKRRTRFRLRLNKNINLEEKFKGITSESLKCRNGSIPLKKQLKCVRCPKGYYHNSKNCDPCPFNTYNEKIGSTNCRKCPKDSYTRKKGAKSIRACKIRLGNKFRSLVRKEACKNDTCTNGKCVPIGTNRHRCICHKNWIGARCRIRKIDHCATEPCLNGGTCQTNHSSYSCACPYGYTGQICDLEEVLDDPPAPKIDICTKLPNLCENGGACQPFTRGTYKCFCPPGFIGRRCQNVPCDYRPCPENNICVNILEEGVPTTKKSYRCDCLEGKIGPPLCLIDVPIKDNCGGCQNGGTCLSSGYCACLDAFLGQLCEVKVSSDYILQFQTIGVTDFAILEGPKENLTSFSFCAWLETNNTFNYGTILSYATSQMDNTLTLIDYSGLVLWINGKYAVTNVKINDGVWHFVCLRWESVSGHFDIFVDSTLRASGSGLSVGKTILGGGTFVLGQDQDFPGGGFSRQESFVGKMAFVNIWDRKLLEREMVHDCDNYLEGNYVSWNKFRKGVKGNAKILDSDFCKGCQTPNISIPGGKWSTSKNNSELTLTCAKGYTIQSQGQLHPFSSISSTCLASGRWWGETTPPSCVLVHCAPPPHVRSARLVAARRIWSYGDVAHYQCLEGRGVGRMTCGEGGRWSGETFECVGKHCQPFELPKEANLTIISEHVYDEDFSEIKKFEIGTVVEIICLEEISLLTCIENETWDGQLPNCTKKVETDKTSSAKTQNITEKLEDNTKEIEKSTSKSEINTKNDFKSNNKTLEKEIIIQNETTTQKKIENIQENVSKTINNISEPIKLEEITPKPKKEDPTNFLEDENKNLITKPNTTSAVNTKSPQYNKENGTHYEKVPLKSKIKVETNLNIYKNASIIPEKQLTKEKTVPHQIIDKENQRNESKLDTSKQINHMEAKTTEETTPFFKIDDSKNINLYPRLNKTTLNQLEDPPLEEKVPFSETDNKSALKTEDNHKSLSPNISHLGHLPIEETSSFINIENNMTLKNEENQSLSLQTNRSSDQSHLGIHPNKNTTPFFKIEDTTTQKIEEINNTTNYTKVVPPSIEEPTPISKIENVSTPKIEKKEIISIHINKSSNTSLLERHLIEKTTPIYKIEETTTLKIEETRILSHQTNKSSNISQQDNLPIEETSPIFKMEQITTPKIKENYKIPTKNLTTPKMTEETTPKIEENRRILPQINETSIVDQKIEENVPFLENNITKVTTTEENVETSTLFEEKEKISGCEGIFAPGAPNNGYLADPDFDNLTVYEVGSRIFYKCRPGYDLLGKDYSSCLLDGKWSDPTISCDPVKCPHPPKYMNMYPKKQPGMNNFHFGNMVSYECDLGFSFYGNNIVRCQANGRWSRVRGKCARISCGKPSLTREDETIIGSSYLYKDSLHIMCPTGSNRTHYEAKCTHTGKWLYIGNCNTTENINKQK